MTSSKLDEIRRKETIATVVVGMAMDVDAVATRTSKAMQRLQALDADPNAIVAVRRAAEGLAEVAAALRRDGLLAGNQQRLL